MEEDRHNIETTTKFRPGRNDDNDENIDIMMMNTEIEDLLYCGATWTTRTSTRGGKAINCHLNIHID